LRARENDLRIEVQLLQRREEFAREVGKPVGRIGRRRHEFHAEVREKLAGHGVLMQHARRVDDHEPQYVVRVSRRVAQTHHRAHGMSHQYERLMQKTAGDKLEDARVVAGRIEDIRLVGLPESGQIHREDVKRLLQPGDMVAVVARALLADTVHQQNLARIAAAGLVHDHLPAEHGFVDAVSFHPRHPRLLPGSRARARHREEQRRDEATAPRFRPFFFRPLHA
jgi:hypothetical protein